MAIFPFLRGRISPCSFPRYASVPTKCAGQHLSFTLPSTISPCNGIQLPAKILAVCHPELALSAGEGPQLLCRFAWAMHCLFIFYLTCIYPLVILSPVGKCASFFFLGGEPQSNSRLIFRLEIPMSTNPPKTARLCVLSLTPTAAIAACLVISLITDTAPTTSLKSAALSTMRSPWNLQAHVSWRRSHFRPHFLSHAPACCRRRSRIDPKTGVALARIAETLRKTISDSTNEFCSAFHGANLDGLVRLLQRPSQPPYHPLSTRPLPIPPIPLSPAPNPLLSSTLPAT